MTDGPVLVQLRSQPSLADIPAQLEALASRLRASGGTIAHWPEGSDTGPDSVPVDGMYVIIPVDNDWPTVLGFGDNTTNHCRPIEALTLAQQFFVIKEVRRRP